MPVQAGRGRWSWCFDGTGGDEGLITRSPSEIELAMLLPYYAGGRWMLIYEKWLATDWSAG